MTDRVPTEAGGGGDAKRRRLSALAEINLVGKESATEILERVTDLAAELLPASLGSVAVLMSSDGTHNTETGSGLHDVAKALAALELLEKGLQGDVCSTMQPSVVAAVDAPGDIKAYAAIPIKLDGRCLGVLYVMDDAPRRYTDDEVDFLKLLAGRAAAAVTHSGVFSEMRSARERSEALAWVANAVIAAQDLDEVLEAVVEGIAAAVAADEAEVITVDKRHQRVLNRARAGFRHVEPDIHTLDGVAGDAVRERKVIIAPEGEPASVVAPLSSGGETMGALFVQRPDTRFDEEEVDLIVAMANQVAIAIDNVRLLDTTRSALRETEAMYTMAQELVAGSDLPEIMDAVARGTIAALPADGARVLMADASELTAQAVAGIAVEKGWDDTVKGPTGEVLRSNEMLVTPREIIVPLVVHSRLLGVLEAVNGAQGQEFTDHQVDTLQAAAAQAAVAIENHLLFGEVQRLAITDELTGVNTRRHLFALGQREFAQSVRFRKPLAAMMFDLDHFKSINDTLGHLVGDEVLAGVARRCSNVLREVDVLGRYGGEEFAVILPDATVEDAMTVAERVRRSISAEPVETARGPVAVTVSVGVAQVGPGVLDLKTLIDRADAAMYAAKEAGRDRVMAA